MSNVELLPDKREILRFFANAVFLMLFLAFNASELRVPLFVHHGLYSALKTAIESFPKGGFYLLIVFNLFIIQPFFSLKVSKGVGLLLHSICGSIFLFYIFVRIVSQFTGEFLAPKLDFLSLCYLVFCLWCSIFSIQRIMTHRQIYP